MTLGSILKSVLGPSSWYDYSTATTGSGHQKFMTGRNDEFHHFGHYKKSKGKSKSDKKHAILSALTLLAFLFFLNILQNCIREQNFRDRQVMMFASAGPTAHSAKEPSLNPDAENPDSGFRSKRSVKGGEGEGKRNETGRGHKSRTLLGFEGVEEERTTRASSPWRYYPVYRQRKFIRHYSNVNNWTSELSQVSDKDLEDQKLKTLNFPLYWKNNRYMEAQQTVLPNGNYNRAVELPVLNGRPILRRIKKRERTTVSPDGMGKVNETTQKPFWNYKNPPPRPQDNTAKKENKTWLYNRTQGVQPNATRLGPMREGMQMRREITTLASLQVPKNTPTTPNELASSTFAPTTPRNRRSEYINTIRPSDYDEYDRYSDQSREETMPTPAVGLDLNTYQTFPVYNYYNHRHNPNLYRENQTGDVVTEASVKPETMEIDRIHHEAPRPTTEPMFYPTKTVPSYPKQPFYEKMKYRNRYPNHHGYYYTRNHYPLESRYRYSPYRKTGSYEPGHYHDHHRDDYHGPIVIAKIPQDDEPGFDVMKFLWAFVSSFAKPLTRLVPTFAKDNNDEPQCYDLLVCEAQRMSRFMGPTAEALATTVGTLLTWAATEETRQIVVDAINSGRENTCQQQIRDCEDRSGGKSPMTVIAQAMEIKLR